MGLTRGVNKYHLIRATLESLAFQTNDVLHAMERDAGLSLSALMVDGGASRNDFLMQFQADIMNAPVHRPACVETTALGAAYLAGLAVGFWKDRNELISRRSVEHEFTPQMDPDTRASELSGWNRAVKAALAWSEL